MAPRPSHVCRADDPPEQPEDWLIRVEMPHAVCGLIVSRNGLVIEAAPIIKWANGCRGRDVVRRLMQRGSVVTVLPARNQ